MLGCVSYLNSKSLAYGLCDIEFATPARLVEGFIAGRYEAALIPMFAIMELATSRPMRVVHGVSISSRGAVASVGVASSQPLEQCRTIARDPDSHTSNALMCVLMPDKIVVDDIATADARVIIGDPALEFRRTHPDWHFADLGEMWWKQERKPFVFAAWCLAPEASESLPDALRRARVSGEAALQKITASEADPVWAYRYLTENILHDLEEEEIQSIARFSEFTVAAGLLHAMPQISFV